MALLILTGWMPSWRVFLRTLSGPRMLTVNVVSDFYHLAKFFNLYLYQLK
jgi:hypothetical protein